MRGLVKKDGAKRQVLSTNAVVSEVLALLRTDLRHRGVVVSTRLCEPAPLVLGDRVQLQQVLLNLVMNACDAMSDTPPGERLLVVSTTMGGDARIEVRDRGSGIAPDALARVFQPFVTTKPDGLGLGLAICRSIVTRPRRSHIGREQSGTRGHVRRLAAARRRPAGRRQRRAVTVVSFQSIPECLSRTAVRCGRS